MVFKKLVVIAFDKCYGDENGTVHVISRTDRRIYVGFLSLRNSHKRNRTGFQRLFPSRMNDDVGCPNLSKIAFG